MTSGRPAWLRNHHVQSMLREHVPGGAAACCRVRRRCSPPSASCCSTAATGVRLQCFISTSGAKHRHCRWCSLHGWEGSAESLYVLSLAQQLFERGFDVVRLNLRDHGETHQLNRELFHSCRLPEVVGAVQRPAAALPGSAAAAGRLLARRQLHAARGRPGAQCATWSSARVVAVSPVLDPAATLVALQKSIPGYEAYFVRKWMRSLVKKQAAWPEAYDFRELSASAT